MFSCARQLLMLEQCIILIPDSFDAQRLVTNRHRAGALRLMGRYLMLQVPK